MRVNNQVENYLNNGSFYSQNINPTLFKFHLMGQTKIAPVFTFFQKMNQMSEDVTNSELSVCELNSPLNDLKGVKSIKSS